MDDEEFDAWFGKFTIQEAYEENEESFEKEEEEEEKIEEEEERIEEENEDVENEEQSEPETDWFDHSGAAPPEDPVEEAEEEEKSDPENEGDQPEDSVGEECEGENQVEETALKARPKRNIRPPRRSMEEGYSQLTRQSTPSSPAQPPIHPGGRRGRTCAANQIRSTPSAPKKRGRPNKIPSSSRQPSAVQRKRGRPAKCPICRGGKRDARIEPCGHEVCLTCANSFHEGDGMCGVKGCKEFAEDVIAI